MEFHDYPQVAHKGMNQAHEEFVRLLNNAEQELLMGGEFCAHLDKLYKHCVAHFSQEEAEILANHCPNYRTHQQEHERVLQLIRDQMEYYEKTQDDEAALEFVEETLPQWFIMHLNARDKATAQFLHQRKERAA